jgi:hypothetical protein
MLGIKIKKTFLKLYAATNFSFELSNTAYLGDAIDTISNGLIFSTDIPSDYPNDFLLDYPFKVDNALYFVKDEPCEVYKNGRVVFLGSLTVKRALKGKITVHIAINSIAELKSQKLKDIDFGSFPLLNATSPLEDYFTDTVHNPSAHDWIFHPVWNTGMYDKTDKTFPQHTPDEFQNMYEPNGLLGKTVYRDGSVITPFMKLNYVLKRIFETNGYTFSNEFQIKKELQQITLYSNTSVMSIEGYGNIANFNLKDAAPSGTASDIIGKICRLYGLQLDVNMFEKKVSLTPFKDLLTRPAVHDWTKKLIKITEITENPNYPTSFSWKRGADWALPTPSELNTLPRFSTQPATGETPPTSQTGLYALPNGPTERWQYWVKNDGDLFDFQQYLAVLHDSVNLGGERLEWESELHGLADSLVFMDSTGSRRSYVPSINQKIQFRPNSVECPMRLMIYRGLREEREGVRPNDNGWVYPLSTAEVFTLNNQTAKTGWDVGGSIAVSTENQAHAPEYALTWEGEKGIYNQFHAGIHTFLKNKKDVTAQFYLSLDDIIGFHFSQKVRVQNMEYFVKNMKGTLKSAGDGIVVECNLVSVL